MGGTPFPHINFHQIPLEVLLVTFLFSITIFCGAPRWLLESTTQPRTAETPLSLCG
jgi:hypothetical protein